MTSANKTPHHSVIIIGGGQAGLSASYYLQQQGVDHLLLEKSALTNAWRTQRWDAFCLVTPNWQCQLPGYPYAGDDPHGFMKKDEIIAYLDGFIEMVNAPCRTGVTVQQVKPRAQGGYLVRTSDGEFTADQVIVASGGYQVPIIPRLAERVPTEIKQIHSEQYRNADLLPEGNVLVVGSGQSGAQIAEDLHLAGRKVFLAVGDAPRCARFYRGRDVVDWLDEMKYYDISVDKHPLREGVRDNTNHYLTGRDGGRDIDLRRFATEGMELFGLLTGLEGSNLQFAPDLASKLEAADAVYERINRSIDNYIEENAIDAPSGKHYQPVWKPEAEREQLDLRTAGITSIIWCIGFAPDFRYVEASVFDGHGHPVHHRGVTAQPGLYFLGLPWLHTWGSGRFSGIARDAEYLAEQIVSTARLAKAG
ncbi:FAD-dependent oxidoreductase [Pseudomonas abyssi]|jgi:putative flavoprotein involved in K+ transport|uniref:FAD-dependent oxidoreductase n=1 Tax=Pseudomonas abyssi TaxID=170540 RepID=A0A2A3MLS0_9PSED|nr:MSMEG_0569 family flavin-dependent oxidoreductase [Pseudomonas abyssi]MAC99830.1 FAD-dependent oxidoreductase [Pseudomonadales bacterium]MED5490662.1 MSMEG_0569 family flavin-dependent oxidoreductase [Pseudomonadota bacterium]PBK05748.1 FAD-dependent oxidoreductase [Pseudomonas abyssi]HIQ55018.1 MSMEG_0569 family flavin-dependent oxidoreductase [Halopseudomonas pachastrellae]|tara:strand:- start:4657 stop:5916 length:1260 start_codon:yes stop_codon:yes gene_type:complete